MDNAKIYRSPQLARIAASIGILIVHTPPYQPEGRGKIERFFRSVREQFLANLDPKSRFLSSISTSACGTGSTPSTTAANTARCRPRRCCAGSAISNRSANFRRPPICAVCSSIAWTAWCAAIPPSCCKIASSKRRSHLAGKRIEVRFDPLDLTQLEIYSKENRRRGAAGGRGRQRHCSRPKRRRSNHVGILLRLQENPVFRQPRRQAIVRFAGLESGQDAARVPGPASRRRSAHRRSGRRQVHRRARVHCRAQSQSLQDPLRALLLGLGAGSAAPDRARNWIWSRRTTAATWCARSPAPSCA